MNKKRLAVWIGVSIVGVLFLGTLPSVGSSTAIPNYGHLSQACLNDSLTVDGCLFVAKSLTAKPSAFYAVAEAAFAKAIHLPDGATCDDCVQAAQDFETFLAENGTVSEFVSTTQQACVAQFSSLTAQQQCDAFINDNVPIVVDMILSEKPPLSLCRDLGYCPAT